jgi:hypothetical protein
MKFQVAVGIGLLLAGGVSAADDAVELQKRFQDFDLQGPWVYNDLDAGFAEAKRSGKPLLVVFR